MSVIRTPVSRLAQFVNGRAFKPGDFTDEGLPVVRIRELLNPEVEPDRFDGAVSERNRIHNGDLLFAWSATLAVRFWNRGDAVLNQHLFNVIPHPGVSKPYLRWALDHAIEDLAGHMHGSAMTHITLEMLKNVYVALPTAVRQQRIAEYLDRETGQIDALITKQEQLVETLAERLDVQWSGLVAGLEREFPIVQLRRVVSSIVDGPFGSSLTSAHYSDSGARVIRLGNIGVFEFRSVDEAFIPLEYASQLGNHAVVAGDVLVAGLGDEKMPLGRATMVPVGLGPAIVKADCYRVRPTSVLRPEFLAWMLSSPQLREQFRVLSRGSTRSRLNTAVVREARLALPPLDEQELVLKKFREARQEFVALSVKARQMAEVLMERRQALIRAAVTGKIDVKGL
ncbi:restriction endonuclease subunit S [Cryobacterium sp. TMT1-21]|uniref:restriction endonuclease subunit S n=1 Tax=Cryobacterium sp. TMT1-21 TaxID=1259234 RepID=UPI00106BA256|nr:restriction endonuclease subunit S [Cryobacterium sp. TMT1-21]TFD13796.1 restriction endonuclease subunit S [Cryobacterium sp. TMT1-21]